MTTTKEAIIESTEETAAKTTAAGGRPRPEKASPERSPIEQKEMRGEIDPAPSVRLGKPIPFAGGRGRALRRAASALVLLPALLLLAIVRALNPEPIDPSRDLALLQTTEQTEPVLSSAASVPPLPEMETAREPEKGFVGFEEPSAVNEMPSSASEGPDIPRGEQAAHVHPRTAERGGAVGHAEDCEPSAARSAPALNEHATGDRLPEALRAPNAGDREMSLEAARAAWESDPGDPRLANHITSLHLQSGDWTNAVLWGRRAVAADGGYLPARMNLAAALLRSGGLEEAERIYEEAAREDPGSWRGYAGLAAAERALGKNDEAIESYEEAVRLEPENADLRFNYALALEAAGRIADARRELERCLVLSAGKPSPIDARAREKLARLAP